MKSRFCWCDMCGYTAKVMPKDVDKVSDESQCPICDKHNMFSLLSTAKRLPEHVVPDNPMPIWPATTL